MSLLLVWFLFVSDFVVLFCSYLCGTIDMIIMSRVRNGEELKAGLKRNAVDQE